LTAAALPSETARLGALTLTARPNADYRSSWRSVELRAATPIDTPSGKCKERPWNNCVTDKGMDHYDQKYRDQQIQSLKKKAAKLVLIS
jgi:hypothetical protein